MGLGFLMDVRRTVKCSGGTAVASILVSAAQGLSPPLCTVRIIGTVLSRRLQLVLHTSKCVFRPSHGSGNKHAGGMKVEECNTEISVCLKTEWIK